MKRILGMLSLATGVILLAVSLLGDTTRVGGYASDAPRSWEQYTPSSASRIRNVDTLIASAHRRVTDYTQLGKKDKMVVLYDAVIDRFTHSSGARHTLFTNWILYFASFVVPQLGTIMTPDLFLAKGHSLVCSQSSYLLMQIALRDGITARQVGLNGHVVMEAWYDHAWHMFDPDEEVIPVASDGMVLSVNELSRDRAMLQKEYGHKNAHLISVIASREDNSAVAYPRGAYFVWKAQVQLYIEKTAQVMKYLIPLILIALGSYLLANQTTRKTSGSHAR